VTASDPRIVLEDKGSSLAVHYRLAPQMEQMLKTKIAAIISGVAVQDVEVTHGKAVIEIKPTNFSKGEAVREMMKIRRSHIASQYSSGTTPPMNRCSRSCRCSPASGIRGNGSFRERMAHSIRHTTSAPGSRV